MQNRHEIKAKASGFDGNYYNASIVNEGWRGLVKSSPPPFFFTCLGLIHSDWLMLDSLKVSYVHN